MQNMFSGRRSTASKYSIAWRCDAVSGGTPSSFWAFSMRLRFHLQKTRPSSTVQMGVAYQGASSSASSPLRLKG
jgi:hypothetical protein